MKKKGMRKSRRRRRRRSKKNKSMKKMQRIPFTRIVKMAKGGILQHITKSRKNKSSIKDKDLLGLASKALKAIRVGKKVSRIRKVIPPKVVPIPKTGGVLPLLPILAGLASISSIAANAPSIINTVKSIINHRRNQTGSALTSCIGNGLFLGPYKKGHGLFLKPSLSSNTTTTTTTTTSALPVPKNL